jgi:SAM-dependent methyltransferase
MRAEHLPFASGPEWKMIRSVVAPSIEAWERLYSNQPERLPWVAGEIPLQILQHFFRSVAKPHRILDFGCGLGRLSRLLDSWGGLVLGADCSRSALDYAEPLERGIYVRATSLGDFPGSQFDGLLLWGVLHHQEPTAWGRWIGDASRVLRPGGVFLVGGFARSDVEFGGRLRRISPTTGGACYALPEGKLQSLLKQAGFQSISWNQMTLRDGVRAVNRFWLSFQAECPLEGR